MSLASLLSVPLLKWIADFLQLGFPPLSLYFGTQIPTSCRLTPRVLRRSRRKRDDNKTGRVSSEPYFHGSLGFVGVIAY